MTKEFYANIEATTDEVRARIMKDMGTSMSINPLYAQTFAALHGAYVQSVLTAGRPANPLDSYAIQILHHLAVLVGANPADTALPFDRIAAHAIGGAAHVRTSIQAEWEADKAREAKEEAYQRQANPERGPDRGFELREMMARQNANAADLGSRDRRSVGE